MISIGKNKGLRMTKPSFQLWKFDNRINPKKKKRGKDNKEQNFFLILSQGHAFILLSLERKMETGRECKRDTDMRRKHD